MHLDGLRVDAVASMLYLDYGRDYGKWDPNRFGGIEYLEAVEFFRHLNSIIHQRIPGALMIAEESTNFPGVTTPPEEGGLGFDMKWNMGWMNDTLDYFTTEHDQRPEGHHHLTFGLVYMFQERYLSPISHDEVVHEKRSLLGKMPGDIPEKFANLRLFYSYLVCQPGKSLLFMGGEIGQLNEWNCKKELDWMVLDLDLHQKHQLLVKDLNKFYQEHPALWEKDFSQEGFQWVTFSDQLNSVIAYLRQGNETALLCVHNFQPKRHSAYYLKVPGLQFIQEVFSTDSTKYGGEGKEAGNETLVQDSQGVTISLAPLATQIYEVRIR